MPFKFTTKAKTLSDLRGTLSSAKILPLCSFTISEWNQSPQNHLKNIKKSLGNGPWIVRSSCKNEDQSEHSNAGAYASIQNVTVSQLKSSIQTVIDSYGENDSNDEVLIQPMLQNVICSGVAFSHDPSTCSPYRIINWTDGSDTTFVTSGKGGQTWQRAASAKGEESFPVNNVVTLIEELLSISGNTPLDCEFAFSQDESKDITCWLLQARPLVLASNILSENHQELLLKSISQKVTRGMQPHPFLMGKTTLFGVMPDWNPAEIIGIRPRPLALSLYRELITDSIWAYQRHNYGYRNLRSFPLMPHFFGLPYIDVRLSFNSFIPASLNDQLAGKLVDYYMQRLMEEPTLHDKIEFEIVFSCYTLDLSKRLQKLLDYGFSQKEIAQINDSLRELTNNVISPTKGYWTSDRDRLETLSKRREQLLKSNSDILDKIYWLLEDAKRYGTLPFAGLARAGFIAVQMLRSFVTVGIFTESDYENFYSGLSTINRKLIQDRCQLSKSLFLAQYGHLRPGTYDILSQRYDEAPDFYFNWDKTVPKSVEHVKPFSVTLPQLKILRTQLEEHQLDIDTVELFEFLQAGIELRELAKFKFTQNLSDVLSLITNLGLSMGFSKDDLSYCDINIFKELHITASNSKELISLSIQQGKKNYMNTLKIALPPLISKPNDIWSFKWPESEPNFITQKIVTAKVCNHLNKDRLSNSIVCISNADPGFDWLFSYPIAGLITAWGGTNSHMAIRAGELGLPAVIGAGEALFSKWSSANKLQLNCASKKVEII
jgi:phosphohistidine swiveling domain-containing protein/DNA-binding transcriptional MerR regulator